MTHNLIQFKRWLKKTNSWWWLFYLELKALVLTHNYFQYQVSLVSLVKTKTGCQAIVCVYESTSFFKTKADITKVGAFMDSMVNAQPLCSYWVTVDEIKQSELWMCECVYLWGGQVWRVVPGLWTVGWCWHTDGHYLGPTFFSPEET